MAGTSTPDSLVRNRKRVEELLGIVGACLGLAVFGPEIGLKPDLRFLTGGLAIGLLGSTLRAWAVAYQRALPNDQLLTTGPFSVFRHPRYVGTLMVVVSACAMLDGSGRWMPLTASVAVLGYVAFRHRAKAIEEDENLSALFGQDFDLYRARFSPIPVSLPTGPLLLWPKAPWKFWLTRVWGCAIVTLLVAVVVFSRNW